MAARLAWSPSRWEPWPRCAAAPGKLKPALPPGPGTSRALAEGTHNHICSLPERGGENNQEGRDRDQTREYQYPTELHNRFKASTAAQGLEMTVVLMAFIEGYVAKHGSIAPQKKSRRA